MIVLDASVLIAQLESGDAHHARAVRLLGALVQTDLGSSSMTLAEVLVSYADAGRIDEGQRQLERLEIADLSFGPLAARRLAEIRSRTRLKLPDCCVLLAAQDAGAQAIATFDGRLADAARALGIAVTDA